MVEGPAHGVLGTLWLVGKKSGVDLQSFPIDAEILTIGRYALLYHVSCNEISS
jgi:hypothetical protein